MDGIGTTARWEGMVVLLVTLIGPGPPFLGRLSPHYRFPWHICFVWCFWQGAQGA